MIQLTYEPAFDAYHATFRLLRLHRVLEKAGVLPKDHVRILDFYLLFPYRIESIRLIPSHRKYRKLANAYEDYKPYGGLPDDRLLFDRMKPMQITALETMQNQRLIDADRWRHGEVLAIPGEIPPPLKSRVEAINNGDAELEAFLGLLATDYALIGADGLKARTGLMEYRQDAL